MELKKTKKKFFLMKKLLKQEMNFFLHKIIKKSIDFCTQPGVGEIFPDSPISPILPTKINSSAGRIPADRKICRHRSENADFPESDPKLPPCCWG